MTSKFMIITLFFIFSCSKQYKEANWLPLESNNLSYMRGVSAVSDQICWISGSSGIVGRTIDGGQNWKSDTVPNANKLDFRDIEAFNENEAVIMSAGEGEKSKIFYTEDAGKTWIQSFQNTYEKGFFCGFAFWDRNNGILMSDPVESKIRVYITRNGGKSWDEIVFSNFPEVEEGEYGFAASGTNICVSGKSDVWIATGGSVARIFHSKDKGKTWKAYSTPMIQGSPSTGIFSIAYGGNSLYAVGGDYKKRNEANKNFMYSSDDGKNWKLKKIKNFEFRSAIVYHDDFIVTTGAFSSSISFDKAKSWIKIPEDGYYAMSLAKNGNSVFAVGPKGRLAILELK